MNLFTTGTKQILQSIKRTTQIPVSFMIPHQNCRYKSAWVHSTTFLPDPHLQLMEKDPDVNGILYSFKF